MANTETTQSSDPSKPVFGPVTGAVYERQMGRWSRRLVEPFLDFVGADHDCRSALDVGCGTGSLSFAIAKRNASTTVVGSDISEALLAHARVENPYRDRVRFEPGDACNLPFPDGSFQLVLSSLVLMFVPDGTRAAHEMARVAKPEGIVAAATWDFRGGLTVTRVMADTVVGTGIPGGAAWRARLMGGPGVRPGHLATMWRDAGLRHVREAEITIRMNFANFADYWEPVSQGSTLPGLLNGLPPEAKWLERIRDALENAFLLGDPDGPRSFAATAWVVAGVR